MKKVLLFYYLLVSTNGLVAGGDPVVLGSKPAGMGKASVAAGGLWSVCNNPAGMVFSIGLETGVFVENRFLVPELSTGSFAVTYNCKAGAFGGYAVHFGSSLYSEVQAAVGYSRRFGKKFSAGVVFDYLLIAQQELYGSRSLVSFQAGLMFRPDNKWSAGVHVVNPVPIHLSSGNEDNLPVLFRAGFYRVFSGIVELAAEIEKPLQGKAVIRTGLEYRPARILSLRIGFATQPQMVTAGAGLDFGSLHIGIASSWQPELGYSPQAALEWRPGKKKMTND